VSIHKLPLPWREGARGRGNMFAAQRNYTSFSPPP